MDTDGNVVHYSSLWYWFWLVTSTWSETQSEKQLEDKTPPMIPASLREVRQKLNDLQTAAGSDNDPYASEEGQTLLKEERRLNRIELNKLTIDERFKLMMGQEITP